MLTRLFNSSLLLTLSIFALPLGLLAGLLALNTGYAGPALSFQSDKWLALFWLSCLCVTGSIVVILACGKWSTDKKSYRSNLIGGVIMVMVTLLLFEVAIRVVTTSHPFGKQLGALVFKPYDWEAAKRYNQELFENSLAKDAYYVGHPKFGWAIAPARESKDGLYKSSVEGLRSERVGDVLATIDKPRIALFGDSFVFSEEVGFRDSLGFHLQEAVGDQQQVLNFGVPGYGLDQAHLRFSEEVDDWQPRIAVLGFIADDLNRATTVYAFLKPSWGIPFSKPRFIVEGQALNLVNVPNITPNEMFGANTITELPHLGLDASYFGFDWKWHAGHSLMTFRALASIFPRYPGALDIPSEEQISELGGHLAHAFAVSAQNKGMDSLVMYLPSRSDYTGRSLATKNGAISYARQLGTDIIDMTDCLAPNAERNELFVDEGMHYSGMGNQALTSCLLDVYPTIYPPEEAPLALVPRANR